MVFHLVSGIGISHLFALFALSALTDVGWSLTIYPMEDRDLEKLLRDILHRLGVRIRVEQLEDGNGGFCKLDQEPLVVLSMTSTRKQRIDILISALRRLDTTGIFIPPAIRDLLEES